MKPDPMRVWLTRLSLAAGIAFTAHAEYELARALGADPVIAAMLPVAIDAYVVAALRWFRALDVALSLTLMSAAQVAAHLLDAKVVKVGVDLVVVVSLLVPVALWRTHALARHDKDEPPVPAGAEAPEYTAAREPRPVPGAYPASGTPVRPVPEAVPNGARLLPIVGRPNARALAATAGGTRPEVRAQYVPQPVPDEDPLTAQARTDFSDDMPPSVRRLRERYGIGQARAQRIRDELRHEMSMAALFTGERS